MLVKLPELKEYGIAIKAKNSLEALQGLKQLLPEFFLAVVISGEQIPEPPAFLSKGLENKYFLNANALYGGNNILKF